MSGSAESAEAAGVHVVTSAHLQVYTARIDCTDADALDITRMGATRAAKERASFPGEPFAPSWEIVAAAKHSRTFVETWRKAGNDDKASEIERRHFAQVMQQYVAEMRASYRRHRGAWDALLGRPRVVLCCFCTNPELCHRTVLGRDILTRMGAVFCGEV